MTVALGLPRVSAERLGYRVVIVTLYVFVLAWYFNHDPDLRTFVGMVRIPRFAGESALAANMPSLSFMVFGTVLALEQPADYLRHPNWMVAVRCGRDWWRFARCCMLLGVYAAMFAGVQLAASCLLIRGCDGVRLAVGAVYAAWSLTVTLLVVTAGCMAGRRVAGYLVALVLQLICAGVPGVQRALVGVVGGDAAIAMGGAPGVGTGASSSVGNGMGVPASTPADGPSGAMLPWWVVALAVLTVVSVTINAVLYGRLELR